jgi:hypothetical protein
MKLLKTTKIFVLLCKNLNIFGLNFELNIYLRNNIKKLEKYSSIKQAVEIETFCLSEDGHY